MTEPVTDPVGTLVKHLVLIRRCVNLDEPPCSSIRALTTLHIPFCFGSFHAQGHNPHHQLETIVSVLGLPPEDQLSFVTHPAARKAIMSRANSKPKDLESYFPADSSPLAIDLLRRMVRTTVLCRVRRGKSQSWFCHFRYGVRHWFVCPAVCTFDALAGPVVTVEKGKAPLR